MILDLNGPLLELNGKPSLDGNKPVTLGAAFAEILWKRTKGDSLKLCSWAVKLFNEGKIEIDLADLQILKSIIQDETSGVFVFVRSQILETLLKAEEILNKN